MWELEPFAAKQANQQLRDDPNDQRKQLTDRYASSWALTHLAERRKKAFYAFQGDQPHRALKDRGQQRAAVSQAFPTTWRRWTSR
jgi:hypothetical protein